MVTCLVTIFLFQAEGGREITRVEFSNEDLKKPKIEDIVCSIQNNEEDKEAFIVQ